MRQLVLAATLTVVVVAFGMANAHQVDLNYVVGEPVRIRLVSLLAITFVFGGLTMAFYRMYAEATRRRHIKRLLPRDNRTHDDE